MIAGVNTSTESTNDFSNWTGLGQIELKKINPTSEQFEAITGYPRNINYNSVGDNNLKPVRILVHNPEAGYVIVDFLIGNTPAMSSTGKTQFISTKGNVTWAESEEAITSNPNMTWFGEVARPALVGEESLISFFKQGLGIDKDSEFLTEIITKAGYNPANIYNGNVASLDFIMNIFTVNAMTMIVPFGVRETVNAEGQPRNYQTIITKNNCFYHMSSMNYAKKNFKKMLEEQAASGYPIKVATSIEFQEYVPEVPSSPTTTEGSDMEVKTVQF